MCIGRAYCYKNEEILIVCLLQTSEMYVQERMQCFTTRIVQMRCTGEDAREEQRQSEQEEESDPKTSRGGKCGNQHQKMYMWSVV